MYNKAILIGRITADPELKQTPTGLHVCSFSIACDRRYSKDGERKADFINIVTWRQQAEFVCRYFHKGDAIGIEGTIQTRTYDDKNGVKHYITEIVAEQVFFVGGKSSNQNTNSVPVTNEFNNTPAPQPAPTAQYSNGTLGDFEETDTDEDIPF